MLDLIICEFQKLKRKKFIQLTIGAAVLFPMVLTLLMASDSQTFDQLFRAVFLMGDLLFLPCVLGVISAMLFLMERDNDTLKNLLIIPVSKPKILISKLCVLLCLSVIYSVSALGASLVGGLIVGNVNHVMLRLVVSVCSGIFVLIGTLPVIMIILMSNKSYIFSIILSFVYAVISFAITMMFGTSPASMDALTSVLPIPLIMKWYLEVMPVEDALTYILPYTEKTLYMIGIMTIYGCAFSLLAMFFYRKSEV